MIYKCELCNYKTDRAYDLKVHKSSIKHLKNEGEIEFEKQKNTTTKKTKNNEIINNQITDNNNKDMNCKIYECVCTKTFDDVKSMWSHKNICTIVKKLSKNNKINENAITSTTNEILMSSFGLIYLIQPAEFLDTDVYKVGYVNKNELDKNSRTGM